MRYLIVSFVFLLLNSCGCFEYKGVGSDDPEPDLFKKLTIVNRTDKTYKNNTLFTLEKIFYKEENVWKFLYCDLVQKLNTINPKEKNIDKNENGKILELQKIFYSDLGTVLFLLSLDGGKRKVFFGDYGRWPYSAVRETDESNCTKYFVRYDVHPVWQEKDLTIHIYEDRVEFSDPKIKEVKEFRLTYPIDTYLDPNTLELVDCSKE